MNVQQVAPQEQKPKRMTSFWIRLVIGLIALFCVIAGGLVWILNAGRVISGDWSTILPIIFIVLAVVLALFTWLFPFSPIDTQEPAETPLPSTRNQIDQSSPTVTPAQQQQTAQPQSLWNIPYRRNPFFTGREDLLKRLHDNLTTTSVATLTQAQAISGLGGIGKTQTAVEYAYRHREEYRAVLWMNATTREALLTSCTELAVLLSLPERAEQDQNVIMAAVKRWFSAYDGWLLLVDNADDLPLVEEFLPAGGAGHLVLTTRAHAAGTLANAIEVERLDLHESMLLLLRRARVLAPGGALEQATAADRAIAEAIARELDGLPLALDQAGAYIEETACRLSSYLDQYRRRQVSMLQRRGGTGKDYPASVATTWSLAFEQVEHSNPLAADLLRCSAFLASDAIPEQLLVDGASELGPRLQPIATDASLLDEAIGMLLRFSLVKRQRDEQTYIIHRLVQAVVRSSLDEATQRTWTERMVRALKRAFPEVSDYRTWPRCQQYLPHALACVLLMDQWDAMFPDTGALLFTGGYYLKLRAQYAEAEPLYQRAIAIGEQVLGPEHPGLATDLNNLANLYADQGKYEQAEPLYHCAHAA